MPSDTIAGSQPTEHRIFVLTFWLEDQTEIRNPSSWRFRIEDPRNGIRRGCVGIQSMMALLCEEIGGDPELMVGELDSEKEGE